MQIQTLLKRQCRTIPQENARTKDLVARRLSSCQAHVAFDVRPRTNPMLNLIQGGYETNQVMTWNR